MTRNPGRWVMGKILIEVRGEGRDVQRIGSGGQVGWRSQRNRRAGRCPTRATKPKIPAKGRPGRGCVPRGQSRRKKSGDGVLLWRGGIGMRRRMMEGRRGAKSGRVEIGGTGKLNRQQDDFAREFGRFSFRKSGETGRMFAGR